MEPIRIFSCQYDETDPVLPMKSLQEEINHLRKRLEEREQELKAITEELMSLKQKYVIAINRMTC
jgi:chromosome segregation ATPase